MDIVKRLFIVLLISQATFNMVQAVEEKAKEGLVAYYTFDEGSGTVLLDKTGNKNDGKINGNPEFVKSGDGYALKFDGIDDYIDCGKSVGNNIEPAGTIVIWYNPDPAQGGLVTWCSGGDWKDERLVLAISHGKTLIWSVSDGIEGQNGGIELPTLNVWTHMAMIWDGEGIVIYKNGELNRVVAQEITPNIKDISMKIGYVEGLGEAYFKGLIDEVRIYRRALSHEEVKNLYEATKR